LKTGDKVSKHSPYCGITGYRLFPRQQSMELDTIGTSDQMAIVVSKDALDYNAINAAISRSGSSTFEGKVNEAVQAIQIRSARFNNTSQGQMYFKVAANDNKAVACIVTIDKQ
jgi:hypothetical protein